MFIQGKGGKQKQSQTRLKYDKNSVIEIVKII